MNLSNILESLRWFSNVVAQRHILGVRSQGGYDLKFELGRDFCTPKFHHHVFTRLEVIMLTNRHTDKQTPLKTSNALRYATTLGNNTSLENFTSGGSRERPGWATALVIYSQNRFIYNILVHTKRPYMHVTCSAA